MAEPAVPVAQLRGLVRLLWPDEITPVAKRQLEAVCDQHDSDEASDKEKARRLRKLIGAEIFLAEAMLEIEEPYARGRVDAYQFVIRAIDDRWPDLEAEPDG